LSIKEQLNFLDAVIAKPDTGMSCSIRIFLGLLAISLSLNHVASLARIPSTKRSIRCRKLSIKAGER
jgi:hypothetical protein